MSSILCGVRAAVLASLALAPKTGGGLGALVGDTAGGGGLALGGDTGGVPAAALGFAHSFPQVARADTGGGAGDTGGGYTAAQAADSLRAFLLMFPNGKVRGKRLCEAALKREVRGRAQIGQAFPDRKWRRRLKYISPAQIKRVFLTGKVHRPA
jgi:hypothetical protein